MSGSRSMVETGHGLDRDGALRLLQELDDLAVRVAVQEPRFPPGDAELSDLKRCIREWRDSVIAYLAACRVADAAHLGTMH